jgi:chromosome partitioning protein
MIIAFLNQKGGTGKTTLSINVSHALALESNILVVDADPQGSARDWSAARQTDPLFPVVGIDRPVIHKELGNLVGNYDHIIIDGPPRVSDLARSAIMAADMVVIPVQPSPYDVWAAEEIVTLVKEASVFKENIKCVFVINRKISNTVIGAEVREALAEYDFKTLSTAIHQRVIFAESAASGSTVIEQEPNSQATDEIKSLTQELLEVK